MTEAPITSPQSINEPARYGLPRGLLVILGVAAGVVVVAGMRAVPQIIGPVFTAVVLIITVDPVRTSLLKRGAPRWLASTAAFLSVVAIVVGLFAATILGIVQLATLLPQYSEEIQQQLSGIESWLAGMGVTSADIQSALSGVSASTIASFAQTLLGSITGVVSSVLLALVVCIFLTVDGMVFGERMAKVRAGREAVLDALGVFARGTRKYFGVATVFGGIVAILDWAALLLLGVPAAGLWALLAFVTNYIPNIGFIIGLIPPALLALVTGGPGLMIAVIVTYCALNFVIQSVLQPKFVGDAVGLTTTVSFLSLIVWTYILGPIGAIMAIPASLLFKALLIDVDPRAQWLELFFGDRPVFTSRRSKRAARKPVSPADSVDEAGSSADPDKHSDAVHGTVTG
jgi:predicted PurR-regulated permease PerM